MNLVIFDRDFNCIYLVIIIPVLSFLEADHWLQSWIFIACSILPFFVFCLWIFEISAIVILLGFITIFSIKESYITMLHL